MVDCLDLVLGQAMSKRKGSVLQVIHSGGFYGAERMLADHCLASGGQMDSLLVLISPPDGLRQQFERLGIKCRECDSVDGLARLALDEGGVINAHNFKAQVYAWLVAGRTGLPLVFTQHGFTPRSLKQRLYMWASIALCLTPRVDKVVCVADSIARVHRRFLVPLRKLEVVPNGLPEHAVPPRSSGQPLIGFVGRLSQEKGPDTFLQAITPVLKQNPDAAAVFLGDGPMYEELQREIEKLGLAGRVVLAGYQSEMADWLARLSVLVISSRTEGTPMVLLEAMQAGTPVVSFAVGGVPDVIRHEREGLLAEPEDVQQLADCIIRILQLPQETELLTERARIRQQEKYSMTRNFKQWLSIYRTVLERN